MPNLLVEGCRVASALSVISLSARKENLVANPVKVWSKESLDLKIKDETG